MDLDGNIRGQRVHPTLGSNAKGQQITLRDHNYPHSGKTQSPCFSQRLLFLFLTNQPGPPSRTQVSPDSGVNAGDSAELCSGFELLEISMSVVLLIQCFFYTSLTALSHKYFICWSWPHNQFTIPRLG